MDKKDLLGKMQSEHARLEHILSRLTARQKSTPGIYGESSEMSVKDILAHITAWERMEADWLRDTLLGRPVIRFAPGYEIGPHTSEEDDQAVTDALNARIFEQNKARSYDEVLADYRAAHGDLLSAVRSMPEAALNAPGGPGWWSDEPIWDTVADNGYGHIQEHTNEIAAWLAASSPSAGRHNKLC